MIIDQPEEDLDNPVMLEIVEQVWQAKKKRQIIFASHNANLVVNGDAELVAWCDYRAAAINLAGLLQGRGNRCSEGTRCHKGHYGGRRSRFQSAKEKYGF